MAQSRKLIKARIKSVKNTRKITKAMELVAASKMRRAVAMALKTRPFAEVAWETVRAILSRLGNDFTHPLLNAQPKAQRTLLVLFTSDRGLAGGYNVNMAKAAITEIKSLPEGSVDVIAVGKRGADAMQRFKIPVVASFVNLGNAPRYDDILPIMRMAIETFTAGKYARVKLGYTRYVSGITQVPTITDVLPLREVRGGQGRSGEVGTYKFEPDPKSVLDVILPKIVGSTFFQALLESVASEHAARMLAMRNASDSAGEMLTALTFTYNQARQAAITQEIAEISSGKAALE
ncbi:MAG: ATP synthase F1 subunit gamma [Candidatus Uhrbacteria bacterium]|nr:ATP synthase F1 subunit gamma [Candidatus Uhrbacteria bacterium]